MDEALHSKLIANADELRELVKTLRTHDVVNSFAVILRKWDKSRGSEITLTSPGKQIPYLFGMLIDTNESDEAKHLDNETINKLIELLNSIFQCYAEMYWPKKGENEELEPEWYEHREVAMLAFLHFFCNPILASVEQVKKRISEDFEPYNDVVKSELGLDINSLLKNADKIAEYQQSAFDEMVAKTVRLKQVQKEVMDKIPPEEFSPERLAQEVENIGVGEELKDYLNNINDSFSIDVSKIDLIEKEEYLQRFSLKRDGKLLPEGKLTYVTEFNPAEERPLISINGSSYICYSINALYIALYNVLTKIVTNSDIKDRFLKRRDKLLEEHAKQQLMPIMDDGAVSYVSLFEKNSLHNEHDLIIVSGKNLYIVEAKASPPIEPFRDADKAFTRIKRHFKSDRGIQKGYDQASQLRRRILTEEKVDLYGEDKQLALSLNKGDYENIICVVVTRDDFGPLASNLNLLLEKKDDEEYPWVVSILELESIYNGFHHLNKSENELTEYLKERTKLHGKVFGNEELEFVGYFIRHGNFEHVFSGSQDMMFLNAHYSDIFDEIYIAEQNGEKVTVETAPPFLSDPMRGMVQQAPPFTNSDLPAIQKSSKSGKADKKKIKLKIQKVSRKKNRKKKK